MEKCLTGNPETWMVASVCKVALGRCESKTIRTASYCQYLCNLERGFGLDCSYVSLSVHKTAGLFMGETVLKDNYLVARNPWTKSIHRLHLKNVMYGLPWIWILFFYPSDMFYKFPCWLITSLYFSGKMKITNYLKKIFFSCIYLFFSSCIRMYFMEAF